MTYACLLRSADPQWCPGPAARPAAGGPSGRTTSPSYGTYAYAPYRALQDRTRTRMRRPTLAAGLCDSVLPRALRDCVHPAITRPCSSQAAGRRPEGLRVRTDRTVPGLVVWSTEHRLHHYFPGPETSSSPPD